MLPSTSPQKVFTPFSLFNPLAVSPRRYIKSNIGQNTRCQLRIVAILPVTSFQVNNWINSFLFQGIFREIGILQVLLYYGYNYYAVANIQ